MALFVQRLGHENVDLRIRVRVPYIALLVREQAGDRTPLSREP